MTNRILLLDLLRAIAILLVFLAHTVLSYGAPSYLAPLQLGGSGVDLFFLLSGWLIGSQLFKELEQYGNIEIKRFWVRRWMRTLPAYYAVLIFTITQHFLTKDSFEFPLEHFFFIQNYGFNLHIFTVSWSLCVEEQFYLIIAPTLLFLSKMKKNYRSVLLFIAIILPFFFRELGWHTSDSLYETHVRWDCCIMGIFLAHLKFSYPQKWIQLLKHSGKMALAALVIYLMFYLTRWTTDMLHGHPDKLLLSLIFATWVIWANSKTSHHLFSGHKFILYISTRSYAIYLLHPDALAVVKRFLPQDNFILYMSVAFAISCLGAEVLYRIIEKPFMHLRNNFGFSQSRSYIEKNKI